jgi:flagellar biosynthesis/type III secretory pathway protein FliH
MATVFKPHSHTGSQSPATTESFQWGDVVGRAKDYLDTVRAQAQTMLEECHRECESLRQATRADAIAQAESHVERLAESRAQDIANDHVQLASNAIQSLCQELECANLEWLREWQHETMTIAVAIAEKLISRQLDSDPTILLNWIEDAVRLIHLQKRVTLRMHPEDAMLLSSALPELLEQVSPGIELQIVNDMTVGRYGVVIQTPETTINRSLTTQLKRLEQELR